MNNSFISTWWQSTKYCSNLIFMLNFTFVKKRKLFKVKPAWQTRLLLIATDLLISFLQTLISFHAFCSTSHRSAVMVGKSSQNLRSITISHHSSSYFLLQMIFIHTGRHVRSVSCCKIKLSSISWRARPFSMEWYPCTWSKSHCPLAKHLQMITFPPPCITDGVRQASVMSSVSKLCMYICVCVCFAWIWTRAHKNFQPSKVLCLFILVHCMTREASWPEFPSHVIFAHWFLSSFIQWCS